MRVMVTGANGQLGFDVCRRLTELDIENKGVDILDFDLTEAAQVNAALEAYVPDCVVHCAAYTAVDKAESNRDLCMAVNEGGTRNIALACKRLDAKMMYISTDYVFEGVGEKPFETNAPKKPLNVYGASKLAGEEAVEELISKYFIVRISWVFGSNGNNFIKTMLRLGKEKESLNVVCDQIGSPTYTRDLAVLLCDILRTEKYGVYHATNEGYCSWYEFAQKIMVLAGLDCKINSIPTSEYPTPAKRPMNSRLSRISLDKNGFMHLPDWESALVRYMKELEERA